MTFGPEYSNFGDKNAHFRPQRPIGASPVNDFNTKEVGSDKNRGWGGEGPFALYINIPNMISDTLLNLQIIKIFRAPRGS